MEINKLYVQKHSDVDIYVMPKRKLKNGGYYGLLYHAWHGSKAGKAVNKSLAHMYPAPVPATDVPDYVTAKFS